MSGSVNTVTVRISAEERARIAAARALRERHRAAMRRVTRVRTEHAHAATRASASVAQRGRRGERGARTARGVERSVPPRQAEVPMNPTAPTPNAGPQIDASVLLAAATELAREARSYGLEQIAEHAEQAARAGDASALLALESQIDVALDTAARVELVEHRLDEVTSEILGDLWRPQPATDGIGQVSRSASGHVQTWVTAADGEEDIEVDIAIDAAAASINGRPTATCADEDRVARAVLLGLGSDGVQVTDDPKPRTFTTRTLGGLAAGVRRAKAARRQEAS